MTSTEAEPLTVVTEPGVYLDMPEHIYHGDPVPEGSLSSTGARAMLPPSCPAIFKWQRDNGGRPDTAAFDFGHAAHKLVLGSGPDIVVIDAPDWRTKKAKETAALARFDGKVPLLAHEYAPAERMAEAIRRHPIAGALFEPGAGVPEASLFWRDERSGVMLRSRFDWLPKPRDGRLIIPDYKTSVSANPEKFAKSAADYGYHQQDAFYLDGAHALDLAEDIAFVFVVQEKTPPYLISVVELDVPARRIGRARNRRAIDLYADCMATNTWPEHVDDVALVSLPAWYERTHQEDM